MRKELQSTFNTRQYMVEKDYELFYYNDLHSKDGKSHRHDYFEFYMFLEGKVILIIDKKKYVMKPGDVYVIPPGRFHYAQILDNNVHYRRFVFWISTKYLDTLDKQTPDFDYVVKRSVEQEKYLYHFDKEKFNSLQNKMMQLLEEMHAERYGKEFALQHDVNDIFLFINRTVYESENVPSTKEKDNLLKDLGIYIENHIDEPLYLNEIAEHFYLSKYYISHLFSETYGISIHQYILKKRLEACKNALLNGAKPSTVSYDYGITDYSSFYRAFKKEYGVSPKEFRDVYKNDPGKKVE